MKNRPPHRSASGREQRCAPHAVTHQQHFARLGLSAHRRPRDGTVERARCRPPAHAG